MKRRPQRFIACFIAFALSACGGGGGGSSGGSASPPPPPPVPVPVPGTGAGGGSQPGLGDFPSPLLPPLTLNAANAADAAYLALGAIEQASQAAETALYMVDVRGYWPGSQSTGATGVCVSIVGNRIGTLDRDASMSLSEGDAMTAEYFACNDSLGSISVDLNEFDEDAPTFEAHVEFLVRYQDDTTIEGSFDLVSKQGVPPEQRDQTLRDVTVDYRSPTATAELTHGYLERQFLPSNDPATTRRRFRFAFSGRMLRPDLGGEYTFITATPYTGTRGQPPSEGELVLNTDTTSVRFSPSADAFYGEDAADLYIDAARTGQYQFETMIPWAVLSTGSLFNWEPNTRPRITQLSIGPPGATADDNLVANYTAEDLDGDNLTVHFQWIVDGRRLSGNSPTLSNINFDTGDVIELELRINDGLVFATETVAIVIANRPPINATVTMSPPAPRSVDDLSLSWSANDPDGDALDAIFEWRVNGNTVAGATGSALSPEAFAKGDLVTGIAWISDGTDAVRAEATVTILDSPAIVTIPVPPSPVVNHGAGISFNAVATDPDGDDVSGLRYLIAYGPSGMSVDPESGAVSWPVGGPMFEQSTEFHFGVTVDEPGATVASGNFTVTDTDREFPFMRMGLEYPDTGALVTGDFDSDGFDEALVLASNAVYELEAEPAGTGYRQSWAYLFGFGESDRIRSAATGDIDGDGRHEIFLAGDEGIVRLDGVHRRKPSADEPSAATPFPCSDLEFGDLNRDGSPEIVCAGSQDISIHDAFTLDSVALRSGAGTPIVLANVDGDPALEIVSGDGHVIDGVAALAQIPGNQWSYGASFGTRIAAGDLDGDGIDEFVAANNNQSPVVYDALANSPRATIDRSFPASIHIADLDGDGRSEILVADENVALDQVPEIQVYRQDAGSTAVSLVSSADALSDWAFGVAAVTAGDFDGDGSAEILWGSRPGGLVLAGFDAGINIEWQVDDDAVPSTYGVYINGGLGRDIVNPPAPMFLSPRSSLHGTGDAHLISMDPANGNLRFSPGLGQGDVGIRFILADYDNDGTDEAFLAWDDRVDVYDFRLDYTERTLPLTGTKSIASADLNGDSYQELLVLDFEGVVRAFDTFNNTLLWTSAPHATGSREEIAAADLDGDGVVEIISSAGERIFVHSRTSGSSYALTGEIAVPDLLDIVVGDTDGDGIAEIHAVTFGDSRFTGRVHRLDGRLQSLSSFDLDWPASRLAIEGLPGGRRNLVVSEDNSRFVVVDAVLGAEVWRSPLLLGGVRDVGFVDVEGDSVPEIAVATGVGMILTR